MTFKRLLKHNKPSRNVKQTGYTNVCLVFAKSAKSLSQVLNLMRLILILCDTMISVLYILLESIDLMLLKHISGHRKLYITRKLDSYVEQTP